MIRQILTLTLSLGGAALHGAGNGDFPAIYNTQEETIKPLTPAAAVAELRLPEGFEATLFAGEPDVHQPIGMTFDSRGRLWVAENFTYSEVAVNFADDLYDRILILEDKDGDGRHDERKVFWDQGKQLTSVAVGFGGVFALCPPYLLFIPDANGDDVPDGEPDILLDGFDYESNRHTLANGLKWGPDGWLYGRQGIQATSLVGRPAASQEERTAVNGSIWRFHPVRRTFELVAQGTTNPWGADWDEHGELFFINTVIGHLWHAIPGAYFERMYGPPSNPHVYEQIDQVADHVHWDTRETWNEIREGMSSTTSEAGGGHAHTGLMIYQGGNWPEEYRNQMFTLNFHGKRINHDRIVRAGASYGATHRPDFMTSGDPYFRGLDLMFGPDGGVYVSDWSDIGECHDDNGIHRSSGRIYRITYGAVAKPMRTSLAEMSNHELVKLLDHPNEWFPRRSRLVLQERKAAGKELGDTAAELRRIVSGVENSTRLRLRALWALNAIRGTEPDLLRTLLRDENEHIRVWAIRLLVDEKPPAAGILQDFAEMARTDRSGLVLCYLASALQRIPVGEPSWAIGRALAIRGEFEGDRVLPLLTWYGVERLIPTSSSQTVELIQTSQFPRLQQFATRLVFAELEQQREAAKGIVSLLGKKSALRLPVLRGMIQALRGIGNPQAPANWADVAPLLFRGDDATITGLALELDARFGSASAREKLRELVLNPAAGIDARRQALELLQELRDPGLAGILEEALAEEALAAHAGRALVALGAENTPELLLARMKTLGESTRRELIPALISRASFAEELLQAVHRGEVAPREISASDLRQLRSYTEPEVQALVGLIWPGGDGAEATEARFARFRALLTPENLAKGDLRRGEEIYQVSCGACHKLYGEGGTIGPELTGSGRHELEYLLENILAPSRVVPEAFRVSNVTTKDERVLNGIVRERTDRTLKLQTIAEEMVLPLPEVESIQASQLSMMPDGLLDGLTEQQVLDLFRYLMSSAPPPNQ